MTTQTDHPVRTTPRGQNRSRRLVGFTLVALVIGMGGGWAVSKVLSPPPNVLGTARWTTVDAQTGSVGQKIALNTAAHWSTVATVANGASGTVTGISVKDGDTVKPGDVLYGVDLRPVVVARGAVPAFRDIAPGVSGEDVRQVQALLIGLGYLHGAADGTATPRTTAAVRAWQKASGAPVTGTVARGDVLFVPRLPAAIAFDGIAVGTSLSAGSGGLKVLGPSPRFTISVSDTQVPLMPPGTVVKIDSGGGTWNAAVAGVAPAGADGSATATLVSSTDKPICGDSCGRIPAQGTTSLPSVVVTVPVTSGTVVPTSSITTTPQGATVVVTDTGAVVTVTIRASSRGSSVVGGLDPGTTVRVPGILPPAGAPQ